MIAIEGVQKHSIRDHYQLGTVFYRLLWGPHIHHGLWTGSESASQAQEQLTDTLADMADISANQRIVDVGCGMGGSSIRLAKLRNCTVTGVTLSPVQRHWAATSALLQGVGSRTKFLAADVESIALENESFDVLWSVECTEHLFDKAEFFRRAAGWIRPGGRLAIAVWFEGEETTRPDRRRLVEEVCRRFVCPSLATRADYASWIEASGLRVTQSVDWTERAAKTWEICQERVRRYGIRYVARALGKDQLAFVDGFDALLSAYRTGAMQYGAIIAEKRPG